MRALLAGLIWTLLHCADAACPQAPGTGPYTFTVKVPSNCQTTNCDYYLAIKPNGNDSMYTDFYIEGTAMGYVAVGLSSSGGMDDSDVLACAVDPHTAGVAVVDAYNGQDQTNRRDVIQNLCLYSANFSNGRIYCSFSRLVDTGDSAEDKSLNGSYTLLYAAVDDVSAGTANPFKTCVPFIPNSKEEYHSTSHNWSGSNYSTRSSNCFNHSFSNGMSSCPWVRAIFLCCNDSKNNPLYLDFLLEGNAKGYVAIGFSPDGMMASSDVWACAIDPSAPGGAAVVDAYNTPGYNSVRDTVQNACPHSTMAANGRIKCSFSRLIDTGDFLHDKNLNNSYYLLYAAVDTKPVGSGSTLGLSRHSQTPTKTSTPVNIVSAKGSAPVAMSFPKEALTKAHAILMLITWPLLATTGIFFAAWMKPALPPPLPATWFKIHRLFMLASLFIGAAGFIIIFVANVKTNGLISFANRPSALAHIVIGVLVMVLHIANPIISAFRCQPDHPRRWIFNLIHGSLIGAGVQLLALANCGIGASLIDATDLKQILGIYLAFVGWTFLLLVALFLVFTIIAISVGGEEGPKLGPALVKPILAYWFENKGNKGSTMEMVNTAQRNADLSLGSNSGETPTMAMNVVLRWISLAFFLVVVVASIIVLVVLIAIQ
ncbi:hypothetical protein EMCRGX_G024472 [Ephydatia muelleri]